MKFLTTYSFSWGLMGVLGRLIQIYVTYEILLIKLKIIYFCDWVHPITPTKALKPKLLFCNYSQSPELRTLKRTKPPSSQFEIAIALLLSSVENCIICPGKLLDKLLIEKIDKVINEGTSVN